MNEDLKVRKEKIKKLLPVKYFYEESFEKNRNKILVDLKLEGINDSNLFKCGPLLNKEQEHQIFRKLNYLKYRLFKLTNLNISRLRENSVSDIEKCVLKIQETRNILIRCNTRLVVKPVIYHFDKETFNGDEFISNGYMHLIKAIDCFDYRRGIKFSTYCTWVLRTNLRRDKGVLFDKKISVYEPNEDENKNFDPVDKRKEDYREINVKYNKSFIKEILKNFEKTCTKHETTKTRIKVIKRLYGLDGEKPAVLRDLSKSLGISTERVRQLRDDTIKMLKNSNYIYDPVA
jgi:RNA polymerase sigma factor (sigma-70 family)